MYRVEWFQDHSVDVYSVVVPIVILCYDFCLTFADEVEVVWRSRLSWTSVLVGANRYLSLIAAVPTLLEFCVAHNIPTLCPPLRDFHQSYALVMQAIVSAFMIIRIYALYGRSRRILAATMGVVAVSAVIAIWSLIPSRSVQPISLSDDFGCDTVISDLQAKHLAGAWACMLLIDTFIFVLTITKVIQIVAVYRSKSGLIGIILRDGVVYYLVMLLVNLANFVSFLVSNPRERGLFTTAVNVTSSLLVSRLAFNVHAQAQDRSSPSCVTHPGGANTGIESCPTVYSLTVQVDLSPQYDMEDTLPCAGVYVQS